MAFRVKPCETLKYAQRAPLKVPDIGRASRFVKGTARLVARISTVLGYDEIKN